MVSLVQEAHTGLGISPTFQQIGPRHYDVSPVGGRADENRYSSIEDLRAMPGILPAAAGAASATCATNAASVSLPFALDHTARVSLVVGPCPRPAGAGTGTAWTRSPRFVSTGSWQRHGQGI